ncbi:MAG: ECF transporter S component [Anaerolineales bacterium]
MKNKPTAAWSTRDLLITIVIGLAFGVLLVPVTYVYGLMLAAGILARAVLSGVYFLPAAFAAYVVRKPGAILLVSVTSALVVLPFGYGFIVLVIGALTGLVGELVTWLFTRYVNFGLGRFVLAGAVGGVIEFLLILASLRTSQFDLGLVTLAVLVSALTFAICTAVAKYLADAVARTGVLANTALGKANADEI